MAYLGGHQDSVPVFLVGAEARFLEVELVPQDRVTSDHTRQ